MQPDCRLRRHPPLRGHGYSQWSIPVIHPTATAYHREGHNWHRGHESPFVEKQHSAVHRSHGYHQRSGYAQHRTYVPGVSLADSTSEINYVALETYITVKDIAFSKQRKVPRHKIVHRTFYFPDELKECMETCEKHIRDPISSEEADESDSGVVTDEIVDAEQRPLTSISSAQNSMELVTGNTSIEENGSSDDDLTMKEYHGTIESTCADDLPSTSGFSTHGSVEDDCPSASSCNYLQRIEVCMLPDFVNHKVKESADNNFIIWLQVVDMRLMSLFALAPYNFIACVPSPAFLIDSDVKFAGHSIGMMLKKFVIMHPSERQSKDVWILTFAQQKFTTARSEDYQYSEEQLKELMMRFFESRRNNISIINTISVI